MHLHARPQPPNCKGCALSLINKQSDSHWKATNTCIANAVDWIQNPIDAFRIHMKIEYLSIHLFLRKPNANIPMRFLLE